MLWSHFTSWRCLIVYSDGCHTAEPFLPRADNLKLSHCSHDDIIPHWLSTHKDQLFDLKQTAWLILKRVVLYPSNTPEFGAIWPNTLTQSIKWGVLMWEPTWNEKLFFPRFLGPVCSLKLLSFLFFINMYICELLCFYTPQNETRMRENSKSF